MGSASNPPCDFLQLRRKRNQKLAAPIVIEMSPRLSDGKNFGILQSLFLQALVFKSLKEERAQTGVEDTSYKAAHP
jgi:predicted phage tail protein